MKWIRCASWQTFWICPFVMGYYWTNTYCMLEEIAWWWRLHRIWYQMDKFTRVSVMFEYDPSRESHQSTRVYCAVYGQQLNRQQFWSHQNQNQINRGLVKVKYLYSVDLLDHVSTIFYAELMGLHSTRTPRRSNKVAFKTSLVLDESWLALFK